MDYIKEVFNMFKILNDYIYSVKTRSTKTQTVTIKKLIGGKKQVQSKDKSDKTIYQWYKFNLDTGEYEIDSETTSPIVIDGTEYTPTNGKVEILKEPLQ